MAVNESSKAIIRNWTRWKRFNAFWATTLILLLAGTFTLAWAFTIEELDRNDPLVNIKEVNPNILVDMRYATTDNFMGRVLYTSPECLLRRSVAEKLSQAQVLLETQGLGLKCWDCYRPHSVQVEMWKIVPDRRYVANPQKGSNHNRAIAVDVTLVNAAGHEMDMPTGFDDFRPIAARDYQGLPKAQRENREILRQAMEQSGFRSIATEWWHYDGGAPSQFPIVPEAVVEP